MHDQLASSDGGKVENMTLLKYRLPQAVCNHGSHFTSGSVSPEASKANTFWFSSHLFGCQQRRRSRRLRSRIKNDGASLVLLPAIIISIGTVFVLILGSTFCRREILLRGSTKD